MEAVGEKWNANFFNKRHHIAWRATPICDLLEKYFNFKSVIDVGCGIGEFVAEFIQRGKIAVGTEGTDNVFPFLLFPRNKMILHDLRIPEQWMHPKFDLALCFMVIGRIDVAHWPSCTFNLCQTSDTILTVVENEPLWTEYMALRGFEEDIVMRDTLRRELLIHKNKTAIRSFYNHLQVFRRIK